MERTVSGVAAAALHNGFGPKLASRRRRGGGGGRSRADQAHRRRVSIGARVCVCVCVRRMQSRVRHSESGLPARQTEEETKTEFESANEREK